MISEQGWARVRGVVRRRKRAILLTTGLGLCAAVPLWWSFAPGYRAAAVVRALESQPSHDYVSPTVAEQVGERLKTLRVAAMARPLLAEVAADLGLPAQRRRSVDEVVDDLRAGLEVKVEGEDTFLLTYQDRDAARAQAVVNRVAARFVERQVRRREQVAAATEHALAAEVADLRPRLSELEGGVRGFKLAHYGSLPEQQEENLRTLDQTTLELNIHSTNLDLSRERRRQLLAGVVSPLRHQEELIAATLHEARSRYTPDHPEVRRIAAEHAAVRAQRLADEKAAHDPAQNPELASVERDIQRSEATVAALRDQQTAVRTRVAGTARNAEELARMSIDLEVVKAKYQAALGRLHEASLSASVERGLRGLRFDLVEPSPLPRPMARPQRAFWGLGAALLALGLGLGVGFLRDLSDTALYAPEEVAATLPDRPPPVLACIPDLDLAPKGDAS
jgi:succinoglycan biosynthesis transport protein ExoP